MVLRKGLNIMFFLLLIVGITVQVFAQEVRFPIPIYEGEELAKVREWEKVWVGKKISSANVDEVKDFVPPEIYKLMKQPEKWGDSWFEIVPYRTYPNTPGKTKFTKEGWGKSKVDEKGNLQNWVSGVPFPMPKSGLEIAWNFDTWSRTDGVYRMGVGEFIDGRLKYDRDLQLSALWLSYVGRTDIAPFPDLPNNTKKIQRASYQVYFKPSDLKGMVRLQIRYIDQAKEYDSWNWIPALRRIRRISTAQRTDTTGGGDVCPDDNYSWDGAILRQTYKLLGRKEVLVIRHQDVSKIEHTKGDCIYDGLQRERINAYVVEAVCTDPGYIYGKAIWYVDPELWNIPYCEKYDKYGKMWKTMDWFNTLWKFDKVEAFDADFAGNMIIDVQRMHASNAITPEARSGTVIDPGMMSPIYLERVGK